MIHSIKLKQELLCYICRENATLESIQNAFVSRMKVVGLEAMPLAH
jgi:hypothetical protein